LVSGAFFTFAVIKIGVNSFIDLWLQPDKHHSIYKFLFKLLFYFCIPLEFFIMLVWWFWQSVQWNPGTWWNPFSIYSMSTVLLQWLAILVIGFIFNKKFVKHIETVNQ
ncbi:MAG: hypothetical protein P8X42_08975, partial [Calditrichaceae bacterium]